MRIRIKGVNWVEENKQKVRFVYRRSSLAVKVIVLTTVILLISGLAILKLVKKSYDRKTQESWTDAASQQQENNVVQQHIDEIGTPQSTQRIAQEELDLYPSDAVIFETTE